LTFWTLLELIRGQVQTRLDLRMIEGGVLFAARHKSEPGQVSEYGPSAVLAKDMQQGAFWQELVRREVARDSCERLSQFLPIPPVAAVAKRTEPTFSCGLD
jgi:hypothetical protein